MYIKSLLLSPADPLDFLGGNYTPPPPDKRTDEEKKADADKAAADAASKLEEEKKKGGKGKSKDEQVAEVRRQRDDLLKENEQLKRDQEEFQKLKGLKPVGEYIEKKFGKIDEDSINKYIEKNKDRKKGIEELNKKYTDKEQTVRDLEITRSDLWRDDYAIPLAKANDGLNATIVMLDKDGNVRYPQLFEKLKANLLTLDKEGRPKNSIQIKQTLKEFATEFKRVTEEDYEIPKLTDVAVAVEDTHKKYQNAIEAKKNWETTIEEKNKEKLFDSTKKAERDTEAVIIQRGKVLEMAKDSFKYDKLDGLFEEDEVKEEFDNTHKNVVEIMKGKVKPTEYDAFSEKMVKASLFDQLLEKYRDLESTYKKDIGKRHSSLGSGSASDRERNDNKNITDIDRDKNPLAFLQ